MPPSVAGLLVDDSKFATVSCHSTWQQVGLGVLDGSFWFSHWILKFDLWMEAGCSCSFLPCAFISCFAAASVIGAVVDVHLFFGSSSWSINCGFVLQPALLLVLCCLQ
ncbi:hypothetical protein U1Q18_024603 [Sarracenia purpurea var. burkii]